jgi:hypothetical protein
VWRKLTTIVLVVLFIAVPISRCGWCYASPAVLSPAVKYAIAAAITAGGVYASDRDSLDYIVNDYWTKANNEVKRQWSMVVNYGVALGNIFLTDELKSSLENYVVSSYVDGENNIYITDRYEGTYRGLVYVKYGGHMSGIQLPIEFGFVNKDYVIDITYVGIDTNDGRRVWDIDTYLNSELIATQRMKDAGDGRAPFAVLHYGSTFGSYINISGNITYSWSQLVHKSPIYGDTWFWYGEKQSVGGYVGDQVSGPYVVSQISAPPVPQVDWPDEWINDLEWDLNLETNPDLDRDEIDSDYDWYLTPDGHIYKVRKGDPKKDPGDTKLIPPPPIHLPNNYPTEQNPDITETVHPEQSTTITNPDGSTTETITQTRDITRTWYDPTTGRWHTDKTTETTTTTIQRDAEGNETGRDIVTVPTPGPSTSEPGAPDDTEIDWEPLRKSIGALTNKFPFSLPWDLMRGVESLQGSEWDRKFIINIGDGIWPSMTIDLSMFDGIAGITRVVMLVIFDFGLIFATRKLMGGDV